MFEISSKLYLFFMFILIGLLTLKSNNEIIHKLVGNKIITDLRPPVLMHFAIIRNSQQ